MVILITGISSGFGKAMAERLSREGHKVYGTYRKVQDPLPGVTYLKADVRSDEDARAAVQAVLDAEGRIDAFISNADMGIGGPLEFCSLDAAREQMRRWQAGIPGYESPRHFRPLRDEIRYL